MEKSYPNKNIEYYFILIWLVTLIGFHQTYTVFFPAFDGFRWEQHFHGATLMAWLVLLIVQPFLIRFGKYRLHKTVGKAGYVLAPLVCISIFEVTRMIYLREAGRQPLDRLLAQLSLDIPAIPTFGIFAFLAFWFQRQTATHVRYITATSFLIIGPGLGRALIIYGGIPFPVAVTATLYLATLLALLFFLYDLVKRNPLTPSLVILVIILLNVACWQYQTSAWWLATAGTFTKLFF
nr:hypothetical protein [uncultured Arsenicibacter sp.]